MCLLLRQRKSCLSLPHFSLPMLSSQQTSNHHSHDITISTNKETIEQKRIIVNSGPLEQQPATNTPFSPPSMICPAKMMRRSSSVPSDLINGAQSTGRPLFWFRPNGGNRLASCSEEKKLHASKRDTSRGRPQNLYCIREATGKRQDSITVNQYDVSSGLEYSSICSLCFSDDSIRTVGMNNNNDDGDNEWTSPAVVIDNDNNKEYDPCGLCFLR